MSTASTGRLIVLEGPDGAGKSTQARCIVEWLQAHGREVVQTREPGGSPTAERIRELLLGGGSEQMPAACELLLMYAARAAHLAQTIRPALAAGQDVVCDRFVDASYAYQGAGRGTPEAVLDQLSDYVLDGLQPDLVVVLDLPPEVGAQRVAGRGDANRFDEESLPFRQRVRQAYLNRVACAPQRYAVIDAAQPLKQVSATLVQTLEQRL